MAKKKEARIRFTHRCGYALADITPPVGLTMWRSTPDEFVVRPVGNVTQRVFYPEDSAGTYTWGCKCGQTVTVKGERLAALWKEYVGDWVDTVWRIDLHA